MAKDETSADTLKIVSAGRKEAVVDEVYRVNFAQTLVELSTPTIQAFSVTHTEDQDVSLCAYLVDKNTPFRYRYANVLKSIKTPYMHKPLYWGGIQQEGQPQKLIVIAEKPFSKNFVAVDAHGISIKLPILDGRGIAIRYTEDALTALLINPIISALKQLDSYGVAHRGISPKNIYLSDETASHVVLGQSFMLPAAAEQMPVFEPFETMLADSLARGEGSIRHDIYGFGVTICCYLLGIDLLNPAIQESFTQRRLTEGTYNAILGSMKLSSRMTEILKGMMHDDAALRWTLEDVEGWAKKTRPPQHQQMTVPKPSRPFEFQGQSYPTIPSLAAKLGQVGKQAVEVFTSPQLEIWLIRTNNKVEMFEALKSTPKLVKSVGNQTLQNELFSTFALQALEPAFPLFYKKKAFAIDGLGAYLCKHYAEAEMRTAVVELLASPASKAWLENQKTIFPEWVRVQKIVERLPSLLQKQGLGYGVERALYELNQGLPCQSDLVKGYFLAEPADILPIMDAVAAERIPSVSPLDKHLTAYIATVFDLPDKLLPDLNSLKENRQAVALVSILVYVDKKTGNNRYPHLCAWIAEYLAKTRKSFFSIERQKKLNEKMQKACKSGKLKDILEAVDQQQEQLSDESEFAEAQRLYEKLFVEQDQCKEDMKQITKLAREKTNKYAPVVSATLAILIAVFGTLINM